VSWPSFSLRHRYTVFAALIAVVVLGVTARQELPVQLFPDTDPPVVTVITTYPGVAAEDVAKNLSKLLEEEFGGIDGTRKITSTSQTGLSIVKAEFHYNRKVGEAAMDVQNAISRIRSALPADIGEPQVLQFSSSDKPIVTLAVDSDKLPLTAVRDIAGNELRDRLQLVEGVAAIDVSGAHQNRLEVAVQRDRLRAYGIELGAVEETLRRWNLTGSGGRVDRGAQEVIVRFDSPVAGVEDAGQLIVYRDGDRSVFLRDVADVTLAPGEPRAAYRFNGEPAIAVQVLKRDEANTVEVAARVRTALDELREEFPLLEIRVADDDSEFTELVIANMTSTVMTAIVLTIIVVLLFIANLRQAAIIATSIPVAFLMTFSLMWLAGIDLNMVTMSAIILAIGLLVDDAIVVLENVHRHMHEDGKPPVRAAIEGTEEIFLADLSGTLTTIAVLIPMGFMGGFVGKLFGPLAWTLTMALASSFIISVTLVPLLTALWLGREAPGRLRPERSHLERWLHPFSRLIDDVRGFYLALLDRALRHPWRTLGIAALVLLASVRLMSILGSEMLPRFDSGNFQVQLDLVPGLPLEQTQAVVAELETQLLRRPEVIGVSVQMGYEAGGHYLGSRGAMDVNQAEITVNLTPRNEREVTLWDLMAETRDHLERIPGVTVAVVKEKGGTARSTTTAPIDVRISGPDKAVLDALGDQALRRLEGVPGLANLYKSWALDTPQFRVAVDRGRAASLGLTGTEVMNAVYRAMEGRAVTPFRQAGRRDLDIWVRYDEPDRADVEDLLDTVIPSPLGAAVPLRDLVEIELEHGPRLVTRENFQLTQDVLAYHYGRPLSDVVAEAAAALHDIEVPHGYTIAVAGEQTDFQEARGRMLRALALGIMAVYLLLVSQFRSFVHPLTIMMAIPLQFTGVAIALLLAGKYLSMPALLGIILLTGTVVNNSIVLIDYILGARRNGEALDDAIRKAVSVRYRPIMMTAFSDIAGMLPLALELAVGAERFSPIATVVIGGILAATLMTLVVIPVLFKLAEGWMPAASVSEGVPEAA
jgi:HAE1 family hydrophobic/amphiphilic exporter-1